jgi:hypothetical protein
LHTSRNPDSQKIIQNRSLFNTFAALLQRAVLWNFVFFCRYAALQCFNFAVVELNIIISFDSIAPKKSQPILGHDKNDIAKRK